MNILRSFLVFLFLFNTFSSSFLHSMKRKSREWDNKRVPLKKRRRIDKKESVDLVVFVAGLSFLQVDVEQKRKDIVTCSFENIVENYEGEKHILVSNTVITEYLSHKQDRGNDDYHQMKLGAIWNNNYEVFYIPATQFYVLLNKKCSRKEKQLFKINSFINCTDLSVNTFMRDYVIENCEKVDDELEQLEKNVEDDKKLDLIIENVKQKKLSKSTLGIFDCEILHKLFVENSRLHFDLSLVLFGHGIYKKLVFGTPLDVAKEFFVYLDKNFKTKGVLIFSCFAGGDNFDYLFSDSRFKYPICIYGCDDEPLTIQGKDASIEFYPVIVTQFFKGLKALPEDYSNYQLFLKYLLFIDGDVKQPFVFLNKYNNNEKAYTCIPKILFNKIYSFPIQFIETNNLGIIARSESHAKEITVFPFEKRFLPAAPSLCSSIDSVSLFLERLIRRSKSDLKGRGSTQMNQVNLVMEYPLQSDLLLFLHALYWKRKQVLPQLSWFPALSDNGKYDDWNDILNESFSYSLEKKDTVAFPPFIPLDETSRRRVTVKKITVVPKTIPGALKHFKTGVLSFIMDSCVCKLLDMPLNYQRAYAFEEICGHNDISPIMEMTRIYNMVETESDIEKALKAYIGKDLVLKNVQIEARVVKPLKKINHLLEELNLRLEQEEQEDFELEQEDFEDWRRIDFDLTFEFGGKKWTLAVTYNFDAAQLWNFEKVE